MTQQIIQLFLRTKKIIIGNFLSIIKKVIIINFIHCFSEELKNKLLQEGFKLLSKNNSFFIFENSTITTFNFKQIDKKQFVFSNKMTF